MKIADAWHVAVDWVQRHARGRDGHVGAYLIGSTAGRPGDAELDAGSDVDAAHARCHVILGDDAPAATREAFAALPADLGIHTAADLLERAAAAGEHLATVWAAAEDIMSRHPGIV
ncbi:hypothetical protein OHA72_29360 [Dactylosporangium sp. NBC_01737]|uniref:hypothetical protein n=1 Tax=Dactylosporangium sp. NBC_01737 TaxID=2975959 RepID=UPI002E14394E|nr:hypothetical protein OHA72_29360 [Dactylosporangium sp. NBC_01737]